MLFQFTSNICIIFIPAFFLVKNIYGKSFIILAGLGYYVLVVLKTCKQENRVLTQETSIQISVISPSQTVTNSQTVTESETVIESQNVTNSQTVIDSEAVIESQNVTNSQTLTDSQIVTDPRMQYLRTPSLPNYENASKRTNNMETPPPSYEKAVAAFRDAHNGHHPLCYKSHFCLTTSNHYN